MLNPSLTTPLVQARLEMLHRAAWNARLGRSVSAPASQNDHSPAGAIATSLARMIARVFDAGSPATWSPRS